MEKSSDSKFLNYRNSIKEALEKEIEQVISQIEEEKRSETTLSEEIQRIEQEIEKKRLKQKDQDKELQATCSRLERKLEFCQTRFDLAQNESLSLRSKIDHMRIVLTSWKLKVKSLEQDIHKFRSMMWVKNKEQSKERRQEKEKLSEIHLAMSRTANERLKFTQKLEAISILIKKDKQNNAQTRKTINENIEKLMSKKVENNDVLRVTSKLAHNAAHELKTFHASLSKTRAHNSKMADLFEMMKQHSKVTTEAEFVELFLNSYEENNSLSKYLLFILQIKQSTPLLKTQTLQINLLKINL
jgi:DNA repair exonuclease SbcCD ATPase subunit